MEFADASRSRQELSNAYLLFSIYMQISASIQPRTSLQSSPRTSLSRFGGDFIHVFIRLLRPQRSAGRAPPTQSRHAAASTASFESLQNL